MGVIREGPPPGPGPSGGVSTAAVSGHPELLITHGGHLESSGKRHLNTERLHKVAPGDIARVADGSGGVGQKRGPPRHDRTHINEMLPIRMWGPAPRTAGVPAPTPMRHQRSIDSMGAEHINKGLFPGTGPVLLELELVSPVLHALVSRVAPAQLAPEVGAYLVQ